jgi:DNA-binding GntR family transcriptional regulator
MAFPERRMTLSERAYYEIKRMIARREILPGAALVLQSLATQLGMSRMPVVEAIRRLERDGLVTLVPQWGATVKVWSLDEIREAHSIRRALEGEAARLFVKRATLEDKRRLAELSDRFDRWATKDTFKCDEADLDFHLHIVRSTRYQRLYELVENSKIETTIISGITLALNGSMDKRIKGYAKGVGIHRSVVKSLLGRDPEAAANAIWKHIDASLEGILKLDEEMRSILEKRTGTH